MDACVVVQQDEGVARQSELFEGEDGKGERGLVEEVLQLAGSAAPGPHLNVTVERGQYSTVQEVPLALEADLEGVISTGKQVYPLILPLCSSLKRHLLPHKHSLQKPADPPAVGHHLHMRLVDHLRRQIRALVSFLRWNRILLIAHVTTHPPQHHRVVGLIIGSEDLPYHTRTTNID